MQTLDSPSSWQSSNIIHDGNWPFNVVCIKTACMQLIAVAPRESVETVYEVLAPRGRAGGCLLEGRRLRSGHFANAATGKYPLVIP
jgi:hypothetical protein